MTAVVVRTRPGARRRRRRTTQVNRDFWTQPDLTEPLAQRDVAALFRALQAAGYSQRTIARMTRQQQSEVSEILAGRRVQAIQVVERIANGLNIPLHSMGLADVAPTVEPPSLDTVDFREYSSTPTTQPSVFRWTGVEIRMLRLALRMSVREFAAYLGVSDRMVSKWEAGGVGIIPRAVNQAALDTCLAKASADAQARFVAWPDRQQDHAALLQAGHWTLHVPILANDLAAACSLVERLAAAIYHNVTEMHQITLSPGGHPSHHYRALCSSLIESGLPCGRALGHAGSCRAVRASEGV